MLRGKHKKTASAATIAVVVPVVGIQPFDKWMVLSHFSFIYEISET